MSVPPSTRGFGLTYNIYISTKGYKGVLANYERIKVYSYLSIYISLSLYGYAFILNAYSSRRFFLLLVNECLKVIFIVKKAVKNFSRVIFRGFTKYNIKGIKIRLNLYIVKHFSHYGITN